jgi:hypothetical protein
MENGRQNVYPITIEDNGNPSVTHLGLTKREYFAGLAMQAYVSNYFGGSEGDIEYCVKKSVKTADALLAELDRINL